MILVAIDFQPASLLAMDHAFALARQMNASVLLLHVSDPIYTGGLVNLVTRQKISQEARRRALEKLETLARSRIDPGIPVTCLVRDGLPEYEIFQLAASRRMDLIVLGRTRRGCFSRWLGGSISDNLLDIAPCPVVTVNDHVCSAPDRSAALRAAHASQPA